MLSTLACGVCVAMMLVSTNCCLLTWTLLLLHRHDYPVQANGDKNAYWRVLSDAGITRQRLESFDRPVRCEPEWFGSGKKDVLIREFRNYLGILKAVHSGEPCCAASRGGCL
jgi:hypothetical protein